MKCRREVFDRGLHQQLSPARCSYCGSTSVVLEAGLMSGNKVSSLALISIVAANLLLAACGGSSAATGAAPSNNPPSNPSPETIDGVATPSSVAVVTATNAN
jgi:hypothetical protein